MTTKQDTVTQPRFCGIIIPVYNSDGYLRELLNRIAAVQESQKPGWRFSVLVIDDGSQPPLKKSGAAGLKLQQIRLERNMGKGAALQYGFNYFLRQKEVEAVLTLDADLQHPPEYIPAFLQKFQDTSHDVIVGNRSRHLKVMPLHRIISNTLTSWIISAMIGRKVPDSQCGYRLYSRRSLENIQLKETRFHLESEFLIRSGWKQLPISAVSIPTIYNDAPSAINHVGDTWNFITLVCRLSLKRILRNV